jgi:hypothetical protein
VGLWKLRTLVTCVEGVTGGLVEAAHLSDMLVTCMEGVIGGIVKATHLSGLRGGCYRWACVS